MGVDSEEKRPERAPKGPLWSKFHGRTVDLTHFRHPGGNIIEFFYGMDGTSAFEHFHGHHKGAWKMLRALPTKEVDPADIPSQPDSHVEEMSRLMVSWRERGLVTPSRAQTAFKAIGRLAACTLPPSI